MSSLAQPSSAGGQRWLRSLAVPRNEFGSEAAVEAGLGRAEGRVCCGLKWGYKRGSGALGLVFLIVFLHVMNGPVWAPEVLFACWSLSQPFAEAARREELVLKTP